MIAMLVDEIAQHPPRLFLVALAAEPTATPRDLFPREQTQFVAHVERDPRLLMMTKPDEVCAEVFDQPHFLANEITGHRGGQTGMIFMTRRAPNQEPLTIQLERTILHKLKGANPETF